MSKDKNGMVNKEHIFVGNENGIDNQAREIIEIQEKRKRIYHYTSLGAFMTILSDVKDNTFTFRAGSVYTMNDSQEMILGYNYIKRCLPRVEEKLKVRYEEKLFNLFDNRKRNGEIKKQFGNWLINDDTTNFVVSFSSAPDILPMWSMYGGHGAGVCLEFSPYKIKEFYRENMIHDNLRIDDCVYNIDEFKNKLMTELEVVYNLFLKEEPPKNRLDPLIKTRYLAEMCCVTGAYVKHECFEYEKEVRMNVFKHINEWKFGESRYGHCNAYVNVPIPIDALKGIIVGPAADMNKVKNSLVMLLRSKDIDINPIQSRIPFRIY